MGSSETLVTYEYNSSTNKYYLYKRVSSVANVDITLVTHNNLNNTDLPDCDLNLHLYSSSVTYSDYASSTKGHINRYTRYTISHIDIHSGSYEGPVVQTIAVNRSSQKILSQGETIDTSTITVKNVSKPFGSSETYYVTCELNYRMDAVISSGRTISLPIGTLTLQPRLTTRIFFNKNHPVSDSNVQMNLKAIINNPGDIINSSSGFHNTVIDSTGEYKFDGWYLDAACTQPLVYPYTVPEASPVNLYAGWKLNAGPTIKVKVNGEWEEGELKAKVNGEWVDAESAYVKVNGAWIEIN